MKFFDPKENLALERKHRFQLQGGGAGVVPSVVIGHGVTLSLTATGRVKFTWSENPGTFVGLDGTPGFRDPTQSNVKGWTATAGVYPLSANTFTIEVDTWNSSLAAADLLATSFLDITFVFSELKTP